MDRHDAKPRRPSLMAGAEPQRPASGAQPARILTDLTPAPAPRRSRRSRHGRAALIGGLGLIALAAVGWALMGTGNDIQPPPSEGVPAITQQAAVDPSTATLVDTAPSEGAAIANPFEGESEAQGAPPGTLPAETAAVVPGAAPSAEPAVTPNPFNSINEGPVRGKPGAGAQGVPTAVATAPRRAPHRTAAATLQPAAANRSAPMVAPVREAGLLQTLLDNIQQPAEPARDTQAMDRLARRLDRAPMPAPAPAVGAAAAAPATTTGGTAPGKPSSRALQEQCPATDSVRGQQCRRRMCERAGVEPHLCAGP